MQEVEVKALPLELLPGILTPERAGARVRVRGAARGGLRGPHDLARQRDRPRRRRRRDAADAAGLRARGADREPLAGARRRPGVLRHHQAAAQPAARRPGRRRAARRRASAPTTSRSLAANLAEHARPGRRPATSCCSTTRRPPGWSTASARPALRVVWRCHVGRDSRNDADRRGVGLPPAVPRARRRLRVLAAEYVPDVGRPGPGSSIIPPSIDPFSAKNRELGPGDGRRRSWRRSGWSTGAEPDGPVALRTPRRHAGHRPARTRGLVADGPPPPARRAARRPGQPVGPAQGHGRRARRLRPDGRRRSRRRPPDAGRPGRVRGDRRPGGRRGARRVPGSAGAACPTPCAGASTSPPSRWTTSTRTPSSSTPCSATPTVVVQKSLVEGFGLTVTEAMWKARPVIASRVGGIQDQIVDGATGCSIDDPVRPRRARGARWPACSHDRELADRLGAAGASARRTTSSSATATSPSTSTSSRASAPRSDSPNAMRPRLGVPTGGDSRPTSSRCSRRPGAAGHEVLFFPPARDGMTPFSVRMYRALQKGAAPLGFAYMVGRPGPLTLGARTGCPYCERPSGAPCSGRTQEADR